MRVAIVTGWTEPLDWELRNDDVAVNLTGCTAELVVRDAAGAAVSLTGTVSLPSPEAGRVRFAPAANDFTTVGRHAYRWKITDGAGKVSYFPNDPPGVLAVGR